MSESRGSSRFKRWGVLLWACQVFAVVAQAAPMDFDRAFGKGGKQFIDISTPISFPLLSKTELSASELSAKTSVISNDENTAAAMVLQSDGKIVLAGIAFNGRDYDFALARLNVDGSLDATFNENGKLLLPMSEGYDRALALATQADGKIIVTGFADTDPNPNHDSRAFAVARLHIDGSLDSSFGSGGRAIVPMGSNYDFVNAVEVQSDGKIVLAGNAGYEAAADFAVARLNPDGSLDSTFNGTGKSIVPMISGGDRANALAIQRDGKIVLGGMVGYYDAADFGVARLHANGTLDTTFGTDGKWIASLSADADRVLAMTLQPDSKILAAGGADGDYAVVRLTPNGSLDNSFAAAGIRIFSMTGGADTSRGIALQRDGKIVLAGRANAGDLADFGLARLNSNGSLDTRFNGTGRHVFSMTHLGDGAQAVSVQSDGKIVAGGYANTARGMDFAVARLAGGDLPLLRVDNARTLPEGNPGNARSSDFAIRLSPPSQETVTVNYQTADGTAKAGSDYILQSGTVTFAPGETTKSVSVAFVGDTVAELNETFFLDLKTPVNAAIADSRGSAYIGNDDGPDIFIDNALTVAEGHSGLTPQDFLVRLSRASTDTITVDWATANVTAGPNDFIAASDRLTFYPGETQKLITVWVTGDTLHESNETYRVNLTRPTYAVIRDSQGIAYIRDDDTVTTARTADHPSQ